MEKVPVKSVKKAFDMLSYILFDAQATNGVTLSELASHMNIPLNSAHNLLKSIAAAGYVSQNSESRYIPGPRCRAIGRINLFHDEIAKELLTQTVETLRNSLQESVLFIALIQGRRKIIAYAETQQMVRVDTKSLEAGNIYRYISGRVLIAFATEEERREVIEINGWPGENWEAILNETSLSAACDTIRKTGHILFDHESHGVSSFACPVLDRKGILVGVLACHAPHFRCFKTDKHRIIKEMKNYAKQLGQKLYL